MSTPCFFEKWLTRGGHLKCYPLIVPLLTTSATHNHLHVTRVLFRDAHVKRFISPTFFRATIKIADFLFFAVKRLKTSCIVFQNLEIFGASEIFISPEILIQ